jgi:hypothetical protein
MRVKALLFTVKVAAALTLLAGQAAQAQGGSGSNSTADFLRQVVEEKATAGSLNHTVSTSSRRQAANFTTRKASQSRLTYDGDRPVKLRAFVPNRKLPSQAELAAQVPQYDTNSQAAQNLSGAVNQANYLPSSSSSYQSPGYSPYAAPLVVTGGRKSMRGKLQNVARAAAGQLSSRASKKILAGLNPGITSRMNAGRSTPVLRQSPNFEGSEPTQEHLTADQELEQMAHELATDKVGMANLEQEAQSASLGVASPAPFPLNLIPEASLKQFIGGKGASAASVAGNVGSAGNAAPARLQSNVSPSYFGSWKLSSNAPAAGKPQLAPAGFHTNLHSRLRGTRRLQTSASRNYAPVVGHRLSKHHVATNVGPKAPAKHAPLPKAESVATYAPYTSPSI